MTNPTLGTTRAPSLELRRRAFARGIDLFLACHTRQLQLDIIDALTRAIERDESTKAKATAGESKARRFVRRIC